MQIPVSGDHRDHALAVAFDHVFSESDELQVVVMQPVLPFLKLDLTTRLELVLRHEIVCVLGVIAALGGVWRVAKDHHDGMIALDAASLARLLAYSHGFQVVAGNKRQQAHCYEWVSRRCYLRRKSL